MYFAATRSFVSRQMRPWNLQLQYNGASKPRLSNSTTKYIFQPLMSSSRHENLYKASTTKIGSLQSLPKPFVYSPPRTDTSSSMFYINSEVECPPYSVTTECLPTETDNCYFAREGKDEEISKKIKELLGETKDKPEVNLDAYSLETLRRKIKSENLKDPDVPPGWERKK
ncbi:unnamed protein product [Arctia plantaginis]|uniref:Uncharacterized protein n=1 Tax=Arctia plantaginis TaxID=874455 RepID=A0A8S1AWY2_ARCPL|nr:unnamed protein product [Arctia plantaginis]